MLLCTCSTNFPSFIPLLFFPFFCRAYSRQTLSKDLSYDKVARRLQPAGPAANIFENRSFASDGEVSLNPLKAVQMVDRIELVVYIIQVFQDKYPTQCFFALLAIFQILNLSLLFVY